MSDVLSYLIYLTDLRISLMLMLQQWLINFVNIVQFIAKYSAQLLLLCTVLSTITYWRYTLGFCNSFICFAVNLFYCKRECHLLCNGVTKFYVVNNLQNNLSNLYIGTYLKFFVISRYSVALLVPLISEMSNFIDEATFPKSSRQSIKVIQLNNSSNIIIVFYINNVTDL